MQDQDQARDARLYIAVRADLPSGLQAAQAVHAAFQFFHWHPVTVGRWLLSSNYLIIVQVPDENELLDLLLRARALDIKTARVNEPDLDDELTAIAMAPVEAARRLCSSLPLALRERALT